MHLIFFRLLLAGLCLLTGPAAAAPQQFECIAPAAPGGGFDLTCQLTRSALEQAGLLPAPMHIRYLPGGVGALAYNAMAGSRAAEAGTLTAWSSGSLLNLAQGKFGRFDEHAVQWLAAIGTSYGAIAVRSDSPYRDLGELLVALKRNPEQLVFGISGTLGSNDWMQIALLARAAGIEPRRLHYVALEGGGAIATALQGGYVQVASTDIADSMPRVQRGEMRLLAVFAEQRLAEPAMAAIPTAREQGYDIVRPVVRGLYLGGQVSAEDYRWWQQRFEQLLASAQFARLRDERQLLPFALTGAELQAYVRERVAEYRRLSREFGVLE
ncbi:tripartite tricarboxylate transporter substrate binding protein [Pseudomonas cavernae]|uniref:Tripartite tricarboxylate transporter substrate binding protein n=1 Tax=Pseudomonas cavernae TaxID=2320867 RepID=A0A385Z4T3_9PSED|nr:tripartite tricarboxylate transporter substrate-binding protein [Pseudomonas cavernae]AYC34265.1 tripartite tricarboxylate transporter substrate binding protein [Pseudomonas cavernae]